MKKGQKTKQGTDKCTEKEMSHFAQTEDVLMRIVKNLVG